jgi:hypothetical protein
MSSTAPIHTIPCDDLEEHEESTTCKCEPRVTCYPDGGIHVLHNSFDGREGLEQAMEVLYPGWADEDHDAPVP